MIVAADDRNLGDSLRQFQFVFTIGFAGNTAPKKVLNEAKPQLISVGSIEIGGELLCRLFPLLQTAAARCVGADEQLFFRNVLRKQSLEILWIITLMLHSVTGD